MNDAQFDLFTTAWCSALTRRNAFRMGARCAAGLILTPAGRSAATAQSPEAVDDSGLTIRPNATSLDAASRNAFVDAVLALKKKASPWIAGLSVYDTFVLWHRDAFDCGLSAAHMGPAFFPWHRMYLHLFDQQLKKVDPTVSLPYWDWTVDNSPASSIWADDLMGGNGVKDQGEAVTTGPFRKGSWEITVFDYGDTHQFPYLIRDFGAGDLGPTLPTAADVEQALGIASYDAAPWNATSPIEQSFRNTLEGWRDCVDQTCGPVDGINPTCTGGHELHNRVHLWVSGEFAFAHELRGHGLGGAESTPVAEEIILGTMAANSSPNDPVFFLHHANIDRLWSEWLRRHGQIYQPVSGGPAGHNIDDAMWPYAQIGITATPRMMVDSASLGYIYDTDPN